MAKSTNVKKAVAKAGKMRGGTTKAAAHEEKRGVRAGHRFGPRQQAATKATKAKPNPICPERIDSQALTDVIVGRLRQIRLRAGQTQKEFSEVIGLGTEYVKAYEQRRWVPSPPTLLTIAHRFEVSMDWIYGRW